MARLLGIARRSAPHAPMETLERAELSVEAGVEGDARGKIGPRQVTVLSAEAWAQACAEIGEPDLPWTTRRANLLVEGLDLEEQIDGHIRISGVLLRITGETATCRVMDAARPGLRTALEPGWRGGVTCRVRASGIVAVGDAVVLDPRAS